MLALFDRNFSGPHSNKLQGRVGREVRPNAPKSLMSTKVESAFLPALFQREFSAIHHKRDAYFLVV
jgi:hypothetical protein